LKPDKRKGMAVERKIFEKKVQLFVALLAGLFVLLIFRLAYMQVMEADRYRTLATQNHQRLIPVEAPRGEMLDRNGVRMVSNKPVYTVSLVYLGLKEDDSVINRLAELLSLEESFKGETVEQIKEDIQSKLEEHQRLYEPVKVAANVSQQTVNRIEEQRLELPGVTIDVEPVRYYPFNDLMGEVLGYVREITAEELEKQQKEEDSRSFNTDGHHYNMGDMIGKVGVEKSYEAQLRGVKGARLVEVDAQARPVRDLGIKEPVPGNNLLLTVDSRLQRTAQDAVLSGLARAKQLGYAKLPAGRVPSGAAVVQEVKTGKILAMATLPSYDLNIFSGNLTAGIYSDLIKSGALRNHAIQSIYTPGSTFKMISASAFLENKIVTPSTFINDPGYYKGKSDWKPGGHGRVDITKALKESCDTFFYIFGAIAGNDPMYHYSREYGLGQLTGIDLPGEETGRIASPELKKQLWINNEWESQWHEYDSMDMAIGQQETKTTAVQLANYISSIANGGTLYMPYLVDKVVSPDGRVKHENTPKEIGKVDVSPETLNIIRRGIHEVTINGGTASGVFAGAAYSAAAKTGTAEVGDAAKNNHALFVAYAPYENPEIAVSVIIEYGGKGSGIAGPVARQILDNYFNLKKLPATESQQENNSGQTAAPGAAVQAPGTGSSLSVQRRTPAAPDSNVNQPSDNQPGDNQPGEAPVAPPGDSVTPPVTPPDVEQPGQGGTVIPPPAQNGGGAGLPDNPGNGVSPDGDGSDGTATGSPQGSPSG
jgi:penicillin-binding protein 2